MKPLPQEDQSNLGFQIAPMIDVVFVVMLFFMVMAGAIKIENHLVTNLPGRS
jgi:biopolymer transport protein ExbD